MFTDEQVKQAIAAVQNNAKDNVEELRAFAKGVGESKEFLLYSLKIGLKGLATGRSDLSVLELVYFGYQLAKVEAAAQDEGATSGASA